VWVTLDGKDEAVFKEHGEDRVYHLPLNNICKSIQYLRDLNIDLAILLSPTSGKFYNELAIIFEHKIAPVQITLIANIVTTGIKNLNAFVVGEKYDVKDLQNQFTESLWMTPGVASRVQVDEAPKSTPIVAGAPVRFVSNAHVFKINPEVLNLWMEILAQTPNSTLTLMPFGTTLSESYNSRFMAALTIAMSKNNISANRINILNSISGKDSVRKAMLGHDIYLDTFPYSGGLSIFDPLSLCMPIVTLKGKYFRGDMAAAMLRHIGLNKSITEDKSEYLKLATELATDKNFYSKYKKETIDMCERAVDDIDKNYEVTFYNSVLKNYNELLKRSQSSC
jgi:predicted O-linked N-acetylglucosamine transferase (SPINDLY family)